MIHSAATQTLLEALVAFVPEDQRPAFGDAAHKFLDSLTLDYEAEFRDEAGEPEIEAFATAARALSDLSAEMRDRVLRSLRALMLVQGPTALDRFLEGMMPLLPEILRHLNHPAHKEGLPVSAAGTGQFEPPPTGIYANQDAYVAALNEWLQRMTKDSAFAVVQNDDGSFEFVAKKA